MASTKIQENDDEDDGRYALHRRFRKGVSTSVRAIEDGALSLHRSSGNVSVISSRLGGYTDSVRIVAAFSEGDTEADERTRLVGAGVVAAGSPPLVQWIFPALLCALCYALYNIFIKKGSYTIHPILGGVILQFVAALLGTLLLLALVARGKSNQIEYDKRGILWSIGAGLWVGTAEMLSFTVSGMGVPATQSIPIIIGGSVLFGALLGLLTLGETMMLHGWSGILMLTTGIALVATDPGEKVEEGGGASESDEEPALLIWIGPALFCALAYALYNICIKLGSSSINPVLGGVILQFVAAIFGSCLLGIILLKGAHPEYDQAGVIWACWAGGAVGAAELLSFSVSGMGVQATQSIPILIGGSVMFGAVLGIIMLGETLMLQGWGGVLLLMTGIAFVATDPGEKVEGH